MNRAVVLACVFLMACLAAPLQAQDYPSRPVRIIVPLTPGSGADIAGRIVAKHLSDALKQPFVVENKPGAGGQIGTQAVLQAPADGYTLLVQSASHAANPAIYKSLPYDTAKETADVALLGLTPYAMITQRGGPHPNLKTLVDAAKSKPGEIPFASAGVGSSTHLVGEYFLQLAGIRMNHIPYKGSPEAIQDAIAGRVAFYMAPINTAVGQVKDGKLAALGVSTARRAEVLPDIPTIAEQGYPDYDIALWFGMWARAGTPPAIVEKLNAQVNAVVQLPEVREQFAKLGITPVPLKADEFAKFVRGQIATYQDIVKRAGIAQQ